MNWLAHLFLSEPTPAFRIGSLLPDILPSRELQHLGREFQRGIERHRQIDAFTDSHAIVRRSILLLGPGFRRFGGILVDMFYDHFLASDWSRYSYREIDGIRQALERMGARLRRPVALGASVAELESHYDALHADFTEFFADLRDHVAARRA